MERRGLRVRRHVHALDQRRRQPVRPGHRVVHARDSVERVVHRNAQRLRRARQQPRRLRSRRLARVRSADAEPRRSLRPRAGHDRGRRTATSAGSTSRPPIRSRRRRVPISRRILPRACRLRRPRSMCPADTRICPAISDRRGMPTATTSSRAPGSPTSCPRTRCCVAALVCSSRHFRFRACPASRPALNQIGYSRNTPVPVTSDNGLTFQANLTNPVPSGQLLAPVGSGQGLTTNLGNAPGTSRLHERINPEYWRYSFGIERQFPGDFLVEVSYLGQRGRHLPILETVNYVPEQFRTQSPIRDANAETFLSQVVSNPFVGPDARLAREQRRDHRAPPVAAISIRSSRRAASAPATARSAPRPTTARTSITG